MLINGKRMDQQWCWFHYDHHHRHHHCCLDRICGCQPRQSKHHYRIIDGRFNCYDCAWCIVCAACCTYFIFIILAPHSMRSYSFCTHVCNVHYFPPCAVRMLLSIFISFLSEMIGSCTCTSLHSIKSSSLCGSSTPHGADYWLADWRRNGNWQQWNCNFSRNVKISRFDSLCFSRRFTFIFRFLFVYSVVRSLRPFRFDSFIRYGIVHLTCIGTQVHRERRRSYTFRSFSLHLGNILH